MGCVTLSGYLLQCKDVFAGLRKLYIADATDITKVTVDANTFAVTELTMATGKKFIRYHFRAENGNLTFSGNAENDTIKNEIKGEFKLLKVSPTLIIELQKLVIGDLALIIEDNNGQYYYVGADVPCKGSFSGASGEKIGDFSGATLEVAYVGKYPLLSVSSTIVEGVI